MKAWFIRMPDLNVSAFFFIRRLYLYKVLKSFFFFFHNAIPSDITFSDEADGKDKYGFTYFVGYFFFFFNILASARFEIRSYQNMLQTDRLTNSCIGHQTTSDP